MYSLKILTMALFLISLATASAYATRHEWGSPQEEIKPEHRGQLKEALGLTPQQAAEIQIIISERKQDMIALRAEIRANREGLRKLFALEALDETRLRQLLDRQAELKFRKLVARHAARSRINQVLTVEQRQKRDEFLRQRREHGRGHKSLVPLPGNVDDQS